MTAHSEKFFRKLFRLHAAIDDPTLMESPYRNVAKVDYRSGRAGGLALQTYRNCEKVITQAPAQKIIPPWRAALGMWGGYRTHSALSFR